MRTGSRVVLNALTLAACVCGEGRVGRPSHCVSAAEESRQGSTAGHVFDQRPQPWQRRDEPVLSAHFTKQSWCKVVLYSPTVLYKDGVFKIWYVGTSTGSRSTDMALGHAESTDGIHWVEHEANPIMTGEDIPWGLYVQTPFVLSFPDRYMMYYAPRDWNNTYVMPDGTKGHDGSGVYSHIGVAVIPK